MRTIAFFSSKGGSGKSTLSIHAAVAASFEHCVVLVDADPQGTVLAWASNRSKPTPTVVRGEPSTIQHLLDRFRGDGFSLAIMDCPPHAAAGTSMLLMAADHIAIPVQPTMPDLAATQRSLAMLRASCRPFSFVINRAPARAPEVLQAQDALSASAPLSPIIIGDRRVFSRALIDAAAVTEIARRDTKAAIEVVQYWHWLDTQSREMKPWSNRRAA